MTVRDQVLLVRLFFPQVIEEMSVPDDLPDEEMVAEICRYLRSYPREVE